MANQTILCDGRSNRRFLLFHLLWVIASVVLVASTWRLWVGTDQFPQIPLLSIFVGSPILIDYVALGLAAVATLLMIAALTGESRAEFGETSSSINGQLRLGSLVWAASLLVLFLTNQHRLQPWAWQFFLFAMLVGISPTKKSALTASHVVVVSIYLWSAIGKFDFQFLNGLGRQFAAAITDLIGLSVAAENISPWAVSLMPMGELLVGILLIFSATRKLGVVAAIGLHLGLVAILGPWGMDHHLGVVIWNLVFAMISAIAFWPPRKQDDFQAEPFSLSQISIKHTLTIAFTAIVVGLPLYSAWDHWLAWGLYSPNNRRCTLKLMVTPDQDIDETLQPFLVPVETEFIGGLDVLKFDMGRMSLELLDAPIYPEARMQLGVAQWAQQRFNLPASTVVSIEGKSDRFTGAREVKKVQRNRAATFFFNHLPR